MRLIRGEKSSTIWKTFRGGTRKPIEHWDEYVKMGYPDIEIVPEVEIQKMPMSLAAQVLVVIPTLERPEMCRRAVLSLMHQKYHRWQAVIVKNGKPNLIGAYVSALRGFLPESRLRLLQIHKQGLGHALNAGLGYLEETHKYTAVLEDDDEWHLEFLKRMVTTAENTGADVVYCRQRQSPERRQFEGEPLNKKRMLHRNQINWPMSIFRTSRLKEVLPIDNDVGPAADWDTHLRLLTAGAEYHFLDEVLVTHYWHESNYCLRADGRPLIAAKRERGEYYDAD